MSMLKIKIFCFFASFCLGVNAQQNLLTDGVDRTLNERISHQISNIQNEIALRNKGEVITQYEGSQYFNPNFEEIEIKGFNLDFSKLRYNAYSDEMEFEKEGKIFNLTKVPELMIYFPLTQYQFLKYPTKNGKIEGYLEVLVYDKDKFSLYKRNKKIITHGEFKNNANKANTKFSLVNDSDLYLIRYKEDKFYEFPTNEKQLNKIQNSPELVDFVNKNNLNLSLEKDKIKLVDFMNKL